MQKIQELHGFYNAHNMNYRINGIEIPTEIITAVMKGGSKLAQAKILEKYLVSGLALGRSLQKAQEVVDVCKPRY